VILPSFEYHRARSVAEAAMMLKTYGSEARVLAGGTDLMLQMQRQYLSPGYLISLKGISELRKLAMEGDRFVLGANTTHRDVELSPTAANVFGALHDGASAVGSVQIRNVATVAGNICNGAPSADTAGPLLAVGASVKVMSTEGERSIPLEEFFVGPGVTALKPEELLVEISIPQPPSRTGSAYGKLTRRKAMDLAMVGVSVCITLDSAGTWIRSARVALTTAAPTPIRCPKAESILQGETVSDSLLQKAGEAAAAECLARTSYRSTAEYRRDMIVVLIRRMAKRCLERIGRSVGGEGVSL
jgi:CO/xanthine dehydrogenase FAD-binding subunit